MVSEWIQAGKSLSDVQRLLREEFSISMTYMDVRFLVDDLDVVFEEPEPETEVDETAKVEEPEVIDDGGKKGVVVEVDALMRPGSLVSGNVQFSDGKSLNWQLSSAGQLGLIPGDDPDYRPDPSDIQEFQVQLEEILRQKGF